MPKSWMEGISREATEAGGHRPVSSLGAVFQTPSHATLQVINLLYRVPCDRPILWNWLIFIYGHSSEDILFMCDGRGGTYGISPWHECRDRW